MKVKISSWDTNLKKYLVLIGGGIAIMFLTIALLVGIYNFFVSIYEIFTNVLRGDIVQDSIVHFFVYFIGVVLIGYLLHLSNNYVKLIKELKEVWFDHEFVYVSNGVKNIQIRLNQIKSVFETELQFYIIDFKENTEFGDFVIFSPKRRFFSITDNSWMFSSVYPKSVREFVKEINQNSA